MSLTAEIRQEIRERTANRHDRKRHIARIEEVRPRVKAERALIKRLDDNVEGLKRDLRREAERDLQGEGLKGEEWEERAAGRLDEFADEREAAEAELDRLIEIIVKHADLRSEATDLVRENDERIERLRERKRRRAERDNDLTKDFNLAEFDCRNGATVQGNVPEIIPHIEALCREHLQPLRDSGGTVAINSGFRTAAYNASIGGATQSYHIYTLRKRSPAADHIQSGRSASAVQQWHDSHNAPDGMGYYSGFTHIDDRGYRSRWYGAA